MFVLLYLMAYIDKTNIGKSRSLSYLLDLTIYRERKNRGPPS